MKALVCGAQGQLGSAIVSAFADIDVRAYGHRDLDLTDDKSIAETVAREQPTVIVNCAAFTDVDGAEEQAETALAVNAFAVRALARAAVGVGATLVHYSTDFVFDGAASRPYVEDDEPSPKSVYAMSKLLGEWFARDVPRHYVLRVESLFGGAQRHSSVDVIVDALLEGRAPRVFVDRTVSPSFVVDVARATRHLLETDAAPGIYHCVNTGMVTWQDLAAEAARVLNAEARFVPVRIADVPLKAARPQFCALSNEKLKSVGMAMPSWADALQRYLSQRLRD